MTFFSHRLLFLKLYSLYLKLFIYCVLVFLVVFSKKNKFSSDYWGKKGVPHLSYWGHVPGLPPRVYAYGNDYIIMLLFNNYLSNLSVSLSVKETKNKVSRQRRNVGLTFANSQKS